MFLQERMKGDFFMAKTKKEPTPLWLVLTQGGLVSLGVYFGGLLGLSALVVKGTVGEGSAFAAVAALCGAASFFGSLITVRRTPWSPLLSGVVMAAVFVGALAIAGLGCWGGGLLPERVCVLAVFALGGAVTAGVLRRKRGKRVRR